MTQRAAVVKKTGRDWVVEVDSVYPIPTLQPGQALVRLSYTGVCHSDLSGINGGWDRTITCDVPGHEGVGRVVEYHPDVDVSKALPLQSKVGIPLIRRPCTVCNVCALPDGEVMCPETTFHGLQSNGTYQQYIAVYASYLVPIPEDFTNDAAIAPILCGGVTSYKALKKSGARKGDWVVVAGAGGGLGSFAVHYGVAMGFRVVGIDAGHEKRDKTMALGAKGFVDFTAVDDVPKAVLDLTGGHGAHAVIVLAPAEVTYNQALHYVAYQGTIVCVGLPHEDVVMRVAPGLVIHKDVTIKGSMVGTRQDIAEAIEYAVQGKVKPDILLHELDDIADIYKRMERNEVIGRAVLKLE